MAGRAKFTWLIFLGLLLLVRPASGQLRFGELTTSGTALLSPGYTATYSNLEGSTHSWALGGAGTFSGAYHSPNFLSYNASAYLNQSRANSDYQSISDASGVSATVTLFGGSHFPGNLNFSKAYDSEGNYAIPGIANYVTHGNSDTFGINWNENLPGVPSFAVGYQLGTSDYSVYGTNDTGSNSFHSLNLHSSYSTEGFNLGGFYALAGGHSDIPEIVTGEAGSSTTSSNSTFGFSANHLLPMHGSASIGYNRSSWTSDYVGYHSTGTIDLVNSLATVHPRTNLTLAVSANYSDNLSGQLMQSIVAAVGAVPETTDSNSTSNSLDIMGIATYSPGADVQTNIFAERRSQQFLGEDYAVNSYGAGATYGHKLFDGTFNTSLTMTANQSDNQGADTLGFSTISNYSNTVFGWHMNGSFGYAQNVQTLLVTYMNSYYNFSGNARKNWGHFNMSLGAGGARTGLSEIAGTVSSSQSYNGSIGYGIYITANGGYSKSSGQALATGAGLVTVPVPTPVVPSSLVSLYGGDSYSFGISSTPVSKLIIASAYAHSSSNTLSNTISSANENSEFQTLIQYQFRKLNFTSGYSRLQQGFSATNSQPEVISSYYIGLSRWFNFF